MAFDKFDIMFLKDFIREEFPVLNHITYDEETKTVHIDANLNVQHDGLFLTADEYKDEVEDN